MKNLSYFSESIRYAKLYAIQAVALVPFVVIALYFHQHDFDFLGGGLLLLGLAFAIFLRYKIEAKSKRLDPAAAVTTLDMRMSGFNSVLEAHTQFLVARPLTYQKEKHDFSANQFLIGTSISTHQQRYIRIAHASPRS